MIRVAERASSERVLGHGRGIDQELGSDKPPVVVADVEHQALVEVVVDETWDLLDGTAPTAVLLVTDVRGRVIGRPFSRDPRSRLRLKRPVDAIEEHCLGIAASPDGLDQSFSDLCRVAFVGHGAAEQLREGNAQSSRDSPQDVKRGILGAPLDPAQKLVVDITPLRQLLLSPAVLAT